MESGDLALRPYYNTRKVDYRILSLIDKLEKKIEAIDIEQRSLRSRFSK